MLCKNPDNKNIWHIYLKFTKYENKKFIIKKMSLQSHIFGVTCATKLFDIGPTVVAKCNSAQGK